MTSSLSPAPWGIAYGLLAAAIWSGHSPVSALGIAAGFSPLDLAALRIAGATLLLLPVIVLRRRQLFAGLSLWQALALAACAGAPFSLIQIAGLQFAPVTHAAAISLGAVPLFAGLLGAWLLGSRWSGMRTLALLLLMGGMLLIAGRAPAAYGDAWRGDLCFAGAALLWASYALLGQRWRVDPLQGVILANLLSLPYLLVYWLWLGGPDTTIPAGDWALQLLYQGALIGALAVFAYSRAVVHLGLERGALFTALAPLGVVLLGTVLLDYVPAPREWAGIALVSIGMLVALKQPPAPVTATTKKASPQAIEG